MARLLCGVVLILAVVVLTVVKAEEKELSFNEKVDTTTTNNEPSQDLNELLANNLAASEKGQYFYNSVKVIQFAVRQDKRIIH